MPHTLLYETPNKIILNLHVGMGGHSSDEHLVSTISHILPLGQVISLHGSRHSQIGHPSESNLNSNGHSIRHW